MMKNRSQRNVLEYKGPIVGRCGKKPDWFLQGSIIGLLYSEVVTLRPATLLKKRLWHRCFFVNFVKFLRTPLFIESLWWLLLYIPITFSVTSYNHWFYQLLRSKYLLLYWTDQRKRNKNFQVLAKDLLKWFLDKQMKATYDKCHLLLDSPEQIEKK